MPYTVTPFARRSDPGCVTAALSVSSAVVRAVMRWSWSRVAAAIRSANATVNGDSAVITCVVRPSRESVSASRLPRTDAPTSSDPASTATDVATPPTTATWLRQ